MDHATLLGTLAAVAMSCGGGGALLVTTTLWKCSFGTCIGKVRIFDH
jgi:hypothetical protein